MKVSHFASPLVIMNAMKPLETHADELEWAAGNLAFNLDFIPDDKLDWKPAPTANSALEIVGHLLGAIDYAQARLAGGDGKSVEEQTLHTREQAKTRLISSAKKYAETLRAVEPSDLEKKMETPFGSFPLGLFATMPVTDTVHHHGQIAYIQSMLGDTESHFDMSLLPQ